MLTFHNNDNIGVVLQAFALQGRLSNHFNCDADVVEYRTKSQERSRKVKRSWVEDCWSVLSSRWKSQQARVTHLMTKIIFES